MPNLGDMIRQAAHLCHDCHKPKNLWYWAMGLWLCLECIDVRATPKLIAADRSSTWL